MSAMSRGEGGQLGHAGYVMPVRFADRSVLMAACGGLHTVSRHHRAASLPIFVPDGTTMNKQPRFSITHCVL